MFSEKESVIFFLFGCMPTRILISILPLYINKLWLFYYGIVLFIIAFTTLFLYFTNKRLKSQESGGDTWWAKFRIAHGLLYLSGAIYSLYGISTAWIPIAIDTLLGLVLFLHHRKDFLLSNISI